MARITLNFRAIGLLALTIVAVAGFVYYTYRPPFSLYDQLFRSELKESQDAIHNTVSDRKYVKFKQLQGAGFNNQVRETLIVSGWTDIDRRLTGTRDSSLSPSSPADWADVRLSALHLETKG